MDNKQSSHIAGFYKDCNVLITGGTGFIGKLLIETFLHKCPDIANIYLLIREKKGKTPEQRIDQIFDNAVSKESLYNIHLLTMQIVFITYVNIKNINCYRARIEQQFINVLYLHVC